MIFLLAEIKTCGEKGCVPMDDCGMMKTVTDSFDLRSIWDEENDQKIGRFNDGRRIVYVYAGGSDGGGV